MAVQLAYVILTNLVVCLHRLAKAMMNHKSNYKEKTFLRHFIESKAMINTETITHVIEEIKCYCLINLYQLKGKKCLLT